MRRAREQEPNWPSLPPSVPSTCVSRAPARRAQLPAAALLLALLIAPLAPRAAAQTAFTYPNSVCAPASQNADPGRRFVVGETAYLCLNINGRTTAFFNVVVDMFSAIEVQGSNTSLPLNSSFVREGLGAVPYISASENTSDTRVFYEVFDVAVQGAASAYPRVYKKLTYAMTPSGALQADIVTFALYTVIVTLSQGVVTGISWDDGCFFCAENTPSCDFSAFDANQSQTIYDPNLKGCRLEFADCYNMRYFSAGAFVNASAAVNATSSAPAPAPAGAGVNGSSSCDLRVYVAWTGTDAKGNGLMSANKRFSRYRKFNVATAYQSALNVAATGESLAKRTGETLASVPGQIVPGVNGGAGTGRRAEEQEAARLGGGGGGGGETGGGGEA